MKIETVTNKPQSLIKAINKAIKDGELKTWKIVSNNKDETLYSHTPEQWNEKAMLKPTVNESSVTFDIVWWKNAGEPDEAIKGCILGRFVEILMVHFRDNFYQLTVC